MKKGKESPNWKGGKRKCLVCTKQLSSRTSTYCSAHRSRTGVESPNWKGGKPKCLICAKQLFNHCLLHRIRKPHTEATKQKIREKRKLQIITEETKEKIRKAQRGHKGYCLGKKFPQRSGANSHFWKGGITDVNKKIRTSMEYRLWRTAVYTRDNYTCVWCKQRGVKLNADHIKPFAQYPALRFAIDNGRTLCVPCHKATDTYGRKNYKLLGVL